MNTTKLIKAALVSQVTPVRSSVSKDTVNAAIKTTQDTRLAYVIGSALLKKLQSVVEDESNDDPDGRYTELLNDKVAPYLCWATAHQLLPDVAFSIGAGGINTQDSNQGTAVFEGSMSVIRQNILSTSNAYKKLLQEWLCINSSKYPEYNEYTNGEQNATDSGQSFHGIQFY